MWEELATVTHVIFVLHNIVFNALSDNKNCCYKIVVIAEVIKVGQAVTRTH